MSKTSREIIFGPDGAKLFDVISALVDGLERQPAKYGYMEELAFQSLCERDWRAGSKVYWEELLGRAHLASAASIIRAYRWSSGMLVAHSNSLFLPFCSTFRSLIEAAADGYDALSNVAATLASLRIMINSALQLKADQPSICKELEDQLIHLSHARKVGKDESAPESHRAKSAFQYVQALERAGLPGLYGCYSELCQYTHPAADSVLHLCVQAEDDCFLLAPGHDDMRIEELVSRHKTLMESLLIYTFNPGLLVLEVLLYLEAPQFHSVSTRPINLSGVSGWTKYESK